MIILIISCCAHAGPHAVGCANIFDVLLANPKCPEATASFAIILPSSPCIDTPVDGIYIPVNKLELLAPYIGLTTLLVTCIVIIAYVKKRKRNTETYC